MSPIASRFQPFGLTIFAEMTALANKHGAVNLAQGFPDFDGPDPIKLAATEALRRGHNQYARMQGVPELNSAIVNKWKSQTNQDIDGETQVTVTSGCTEALAATFLGLINPGDEVILFEPYYDCYQAGIAMAGGTPSVVTLRTPSSPHQPFAFDADQLRRAVTNKTRAIVINTPNNPTGKVFSREELTTIADVCIKHNLIAITDEVYERLLFDPKLPHISIASLPGMADRTITLSSLGKTFSLTGWKIGWAIASRELTQCVRAAHQFLTFCSSTPLQHGAAAALTHGEPHITQLVQDLSAGRDYLGKALESLGFRVFWPAGTYFIMADHAAVSRRMGIDPVDDAAFCRKLTTETGVAAIPPAGFYDNKQWGRPLARFAFCKKMDTLRTAVERLQRLAR
jgi:L-glutamine---4-(methylsulfanyl)-2-oxobutanoate aminotransferase